MLRPSAYSLICKGIVFLCFWLFQVIHAANDTDSNEKCIHINAIPMGLQLNNHSSMDFFYLNGPDYEYYDGTLDFHVFDARGDLLLSHNESSSVCYDEDDSSSSSRLVYRSGYVAVVSFIRLFLLICPLPYHSYNGTALKCPRLYQVFYSCTLIMVIGHMLSFSMVDPASLSSLLPSTSSGLSPHEELTRHVWIMLILSLVANLCHILLFLHVRSTAPGEDQLVVPRRPKVLFYYVKEKEGEDVSEHDKLLPGVPNGSSIHLNRRFSSEGSTSSIQQISNVVVEVQSRIQSAKDEWSKRLADYRSRTSTMGTASNNANQELINHRPQTVFRVLLQLFAYEDVLSNGRLDAIYDQDDGAALLNFVPQLLSFLLHGAYDSSKDLEQWILSVCRHNVYFAHRCYWFLRAWSLESQKYSTTGALARLSRASSLTSFEDTSEAQRRLSGSANGSEDRQAATGNLLPEERAVIEALLHQVMKCGEEPARRLYFGNGMESETDPATSSSTILDLEPANRSSPSALMSAAQSGAIPIDPTTGSPSARHWECLAATRRFGFLPLDDALTNQRESKKSHYENSYFDSTPVFLDALLTLAENLNHVAKEERSS